MFKILYPLILLIVLLGACGLSENDLQQANLEVHQVTTEESSNSGVTGNYDVSSFEEFPLVSVVDGDTIKINYNGSTESVRFLLIDTPETSHPRLGKQPFGEEAKEFTKQLLENEETVFLEFDVSYRDKYKRLLAYVYTEEGKSVQEELLKNGLARVAYIYEPNVKHVDWFESIQKTAQQQATGIWSVENYVTDKGYDQSAFDETKEQETSKKPTTNGSACEIKGNINSKGEKIYHSPGQRNYNSTIPEEMFCTADEAEAAGYRAALR